MVGVCKYKYSLFSITSVFFTTLDVLYYLSAKTYTAWICHKCRCMKGVVTGDVLGLILMSIKLNVNISKQGNKCVLHFV